MTSADCEIDRSSWTSVELGDSTEFCRPDLGNNQWYLTAKGESYLSGICSGSFQLSWSCSPIIAFEDYRSNRQWYADNILNSMYQLAQISILFENASDAILFRLSQ